MVRQFMAETIALCRAQFPFALFPPPFFLFFENQFLTITTHARHSISKQRLGTYCGLLTETHSEKAAQALYATGSGQYIGDVVVLFQHRVCFMIMDRMLYTQLVNNSSYYRNICYLCLSHAAIDLEFIRAINLRVLKGITVY